MADTFVPFIIEQLEKYSDLCASRLFQMVKDRGYPGGPDHFRRVVARHRPRKLAEAFHRLKTLPGEQAQVDWAHFGKLQIGRAERVLWAFVMVLSYSRQVFLRFFLGASMPFFARGHIDAFAFFGGVPRVLLYNNLKSAVLAHHGDIISDMLAELSAQESTPALARRLRRYTIAHLLCVDEVGYLSYNSRYADLLFEVVTRRYELGKPLLLSTNKGCSEWGEVFPHAACVVTLVDRLIHRAEVIDIEAESYRLKEAKELNAARAKQRNKKEPVQA